MTPRSSLFLTMFLAAALAAPARAGHSNSLLDVAPDGKLLLAANTDNGTVTVVDTAARKALREIKVGEKPECVAWVGRWPSPPATRTVRWYFSIRIAAKSRRL
jgi:YVTN family beta-propeller protein